MEYIIFTDGSQYKLVDITYEDFIEYHVWYGLSDIAYKEYKRERNMHEIDDFNQQTLDSGYKIEII